MTDRLERIGRVTGPLKLVALLGFLGTLFAGWHNVSVEVAGVVDVETTSNGWHGWGFVAGVIALIVLAVVIGELRRGTPTTSHAVALTALSIGLVVAASLAAFTGEASVNAGTVGVEVRDTLAAAWIGVLLAVVVAASHVVELGAQLPAQGPRGLAPTTHA